MRRATVPALAGLIALLIAIAAGAQGVFGGLRSGLLPNVKYDGRFTVARIRYPAYRSWTADYPTMEQHLSVMLKDITLLDTHVDGSNVHDLDDDELLKIPLAYLTEPGYWHPTPSEIVGLRDYLKKGGFLIVDDFHFPNEWAVFEDAIRRVLPDGQ